MKGKPPSGLIEKYTRRMTAENGKEVLLRPILPEDTQREFEMFQRFSNNSLYYRFFEIKRAFKPEDVKKFTYIDYNKDMAIIALTGDDLQIGVARICGGKEGAEFAVIVEDDWQKQGVGTELMRLILEVAREMGYKKVFGEVMAENTGIIKLCKELGFELKRQPGADYFKAVNVLM
jgi:acetyltransferase